MRERLLTLALALGAVAIFAALFLRRAGEVPDPRDIARPASSEQRGNGYYGLSSWLTASGVRVLGVRDRFRSLASRRDLPASGNLLIVTLPARTDYKTEEFVPLDHWIRAGNTLLVLAALSDSPDWANARSALAVGDLNLLTGLTFETRAGHAERLQAEAATAADQRAPVRRNSPRKRDTVSLKRLQEPQRSELLANRPQAYFEGVRSVVALSDYAHEPWVVQVPYDGFALELAHDRASSAGAMWTRPLGSGRIIVSSFGSLFTNRALGLGDNARLFANIVATHVAGNGAVLFDDVHQGAGAVYDTSKFYGDPRLRYTIAILLGLWLIWVLGSTRLRIPRVRVSAPREADLVRTAGLFLARVVRSDVAAQRMLEHFLAATPIDVTGPDGTAPAWRYLERHPRVAAGDLEQLREWFTDAHAGRRVPLRRLHNLIVHMEQHR